MADDTVTLPRSVVKQVEEALALQDAYATHLSPCSDCFKGDGGPCVEFIRLEDASEKARKPALAALKEAVK